MKLNTLAAALGAAGLAIGMAQAVYAEGGATTSSGSSMGSGSATENNTSMENRSPAAGSAIQGSSADTAACDKLSGKTREDCLSSLHRDVPSANAGASSPAISGSSQPSGAYGTGDPVPRAESSSAGGDAPATGGSMNGSATTR